MDSTAVSDSLFQNEWAIYLVSFLVLVALFFIQKYAYLIDRKLDEMEEKDTHWEGKPWPLLFGIILGMYTLIYNVFSPNDMQLNPVSWRWPEWLLVICFIILFGLLTFESYSHFSSRQALIRILILGGLAIGFYFAGLLAGLLIVSILAIGLLFYFIRFWRKQLAIK